MQTLIRVIPEKEPEHAEFYVHCKDQAGCAGRILLIDQEEKPGTPDGLWKYRRLCDTFNQTRLSFP